MFTCFVHGLLYSVECMQMLLSNCTANLCLSECMSAKKPLWAENSQASWESLKGGMQMQSLTSSIRMQ